MSWWLRLATLNVLRNRRRSLLTVGMVLFGTALATVSLSWLNGVLGNVLERVVELTGEVRVVQPAFEAREQLLPLYENIAESEPIVAAIEGAGFEAHAVVKNGAIVSIGEEMGEHHALVLGAEPAYLEGVLGLDQRLLSGRYLEGEDDLLLGSTLAEQLGAQVGDELLLLGMTQDGSLSPIEGPIVGIVDAGDVLSNRQAFTSLERLRWMTDIPDGALELLVFGAGAEQASETAERLATLPELDGLMVQPWHQRQPYQVLGSLSQLLLWLLGAVVVLVTALGVLNTMLMSVMERTAEVGVLRALGMGRPGVVFMFLLEALVVGVVGAVGGVAIGVGPSLYLERSGWSLGDGVGQDVVLPVDSTFYADLTPEILGVALCIGLGTALLGAVLPAMRAARISPVEAMGQ